MYKFLFLLVSLICIHLNCEPQNYKNKSRFSKQFQELFKVPTFDFIDESEAIDCYMSCLVLIEESFPCNECQNLNKLSDPSNNQMFCCFNYKQIKCNFVCLFEKLRNNLNENDIQFDEKLEIMYENLNQTLKRIETIEECIEYHLDILQDCDLKNTTLQRIKRSEQNMTTSGYTDEEDAWSFVLLTACIGSIIIGIALLVGLIYLTNIERQHFNAIQSSVSTVQFNQNPE